MIVYGCKSTANIGVTVFATPRLSSATDSSVCDSAAFSYTPSTLTSAPSYTWTRASVTGLSNVAGSGAGNIAERLNNTTFDSVTAVYVYTVTAHGCNGNGNVRVIVKPTPQLSSAMGDTICKGQAVFYAPTSFVEGTTYRWTRGSVTGITPATASGRDTIAEALQNSTLTSLNAVYVYTLTAYGCTNTQNFTVAVNPEAPSPSITIAPGNEVCANTRYMNFGAGARADSSIQYHWLAINATIESSSADDQNILVSFYNPGASALILYSNVSGYGCNSVDTYRVNVGNPSGAIPSDVYYFDGNFVCADNTMDTYQWGYDDKTTLDSNILTGEINQYYRNAAPDTGNRYYWVLTTKGGCTAKTYYNRPVGIVNINETVATLNVYPNPAQSFVTVELNGVHGGVTEARLMDITGKDISHFNMEDGKVSIDVANLASGVYMIGCYRDGIKLGAVRFIKN
jgi:hypothetical protein